MKQLSVDLQLNPQALARSISGSIGLLGAPCVRAADRRRGFVPADEDGLA